MAIKFLNTVAVDTDVLFVDAAANKVGIGTTSPTFKLHVNSTDASDNVAYIHHNNAAQSSGDVLKVRSDAGDNAGSALLNVANNTGSALYVRGDRNVGIGTTSPSTSLDVVRSGNSYIQTRRTNASATTLKLGSETGLNVIVSRDGGVGNAPLAFLTGVSERMRITSAGNVGIGTTNTGAKLEVSTDAEMVAKFVGNTDDGGGFVGAIVEIESNNDVRGRGVYLTHRNSADTGPSEWYAGVPYTGGGYSIGNAAYGTTINSNTGPAHKDQSKLFIEESGDVGIGTTSPGRQLTLSGNSSPIISLKSNTAGGEPSIYFGDTGGGGDAVGRIVYSNSQDYMSFWTAAGERVRIKNDGDTGIGVQDPKAKLDVDGGVKIGNDTDAATADKEGTLRYHISGGYAQLDICMQKGGAGGYAWFNVLRVSMNI